MTTAIEIGRSIKHLRVTSFILALLFCLSACSNPQKQTTNQNAGKDSLTGETENRVAVQREDTAILMLTHDVLSAIKSNDFSRLGPFFHPTEGVRFSPYGYVDIAANRIFSASSFQKEIKEKNLLFWGNYDGTGDSILLTVPAYFSRFVYDVDFLHAEKTSLNSMIGHGNSLNNLELVYPGFPYTESYFSGFDKNMDGMDWRCLRLVFKKYESRYYLVAVIHDQWTI